MTISGSTAMPCTVGEPRRPTLVEADGPELPRDELEDLVLAAAVVGADVEVPAVAHDRRTQPPLVGDGGGLGHELAGLVELEDEEALALQHGDGERTVPRAPLRAGQERGARGGDGGIAR